MKLKPACLICDRPALFEYAIGTMTIFLCLDCENRKLFTGYPQKKEAELLPDFSKNPKQS